MARFKDVFTGSVVNVADEKADRFTSGWEPVEDEKPRRTTRTTKKSDN